MIWIMFGIIKKMFSIVNASKHTKCVLLSNNDFTIQPSLINLHPNKYSQEFNCYSFSVKFDRCVGSCNTPNNWSNKVCVSN